MDNLEKKLNNIFRLRKEQDKIITLRTEASKQYVKLLEKEATIRFEKLAKAEVHLPKTDVQPLDLSKIKLSSIPEVELSKSFKDVVQKADNYLKCLEFTHNQLKTT